MNLGMYALGQMMSDELKITILLIVIGIILGYKIIPWIVNIVVDTIVAHNTMKEALEEIKETYTHLP